LKPTNIEIQSPRSKNCHKHKVTNINMSPTSVLPFISFELKNYNGLMLELLQAKNQQKCVSECLKSFIVSRYSIANEFLIQIVRRWNQPKFARNFRYDAIENWNVHKLEIDRRNWDGIIERDDSFLTWYPEKVWYQIIWTPSSQKDQLKLIWNQSVRWLAVFS